MAKHNEEPYLKLLWDGGNIVDDDQGEAEEEEEGEGEEEEALSLSDLPVESEQLGREDEANSRDESVSESESEFEFGLGFGSWLGSLSTQPLPEMCAADDLFFQGRILPLRRHDSAANSLEKKSLDETNGSTAGPVSRSDSMDSGSISRVTSTSSRSSSKGSQNSSSYSMTSTSTSFGSSRVMYSSMSNQFGSCPSPSPQTGFPVNNKTVLLQGTKIRSKSQRNSYSSSSSSSLMWEFFRPGLVRAPEIELHNLKTRANNNICDNNNREEQGRKKKKGIGFGLLGGCNCTADSVATNLVMLRSDSRRIRGRRKSNVGSGEEEELRRKLMELIEIDDTRTMKAKKKMKELAVVEKHRRDGHTPRSRSRHRRTFEWVKELPHAGGYHVLHQH